jgi:serralysin
LVGTEKRDTIGALVGNDMALGRAGADSIDGGVGDDELVGGLGRDSLSGEGPGIFAGGVDVLRGGPGDDTLQGGYGADAVCGGRGEDTLSVDGGESRDLIYCGAGYDRYDIRSRGAGETSGNVYVAPSCEEEVDIPSTY